LNASMKSNGRMLPMPKGLAIGLIYAAIWTAVNVAVVAYLFAEEILVFESIGYFIVFILMSSSYLCSKVSYAKTGRKQMLVCICAATGYLLTLIMINVLFFGCKFEAVGVTLMCVFGGSALSLLGRRRDGGFNRGHVRKKTRR